MYALLGILTQVLLQISYADLLFDENRPLRDDASELSARFVKAYSEAKSLCIAVDIRDSYGIEFLAITRMLPNAISSDFYIYKYDRFHPSLTYRHKEGVSTEERWFGGYRKSTYSSPSPNGSTTYRVVREDGIGAEYGCFIASCMQSWIGIIPRNSYVDILSERLCNSEIVGNVSLNGEICDMATYRHINDSSIADVFFVASSGFLVGWDHYVIKSDGCWIREREKRFSIISVLSE